MWQAVLLDLLLLIVIVKHRVNALLVKPARSGIAGFVTREGTG